MPISERDSRAANAGEHRFATTHWSVIVAAGDGHSPEAREALGVLCRTYWYPLYAYVRRQGFAPDGAQDLTQEFFARFLEKDFLAQVDRAKGRFRSFLLTACKHFLANERDRAAAKKRSGGREIAALDFRSAEDRYSLEPAHCLTPEKLFERRWAMTLLDQVLARLRQEFVVADKAKHFDVLKAFLTGQKYTEAHGEVGRKLGMSQGAVKVAVHRLRRRYRELLREEIMRTLDDQSEIEDEIRNLFTALGS